MPVISTMKMTPRPFLQLAEDPVGVRLELVDGAVAVGPGITPEYSHCDIVLGCFIMEHIDRDRSGMLLGDVGVIFGQFNLRRPDLAYIRRDRRHIIGKLAMEGPPESLC